MARVIGTEAVEDGWRRGRTVLEVLPGDIVTEMARETAVRLGVRLADGPVERPVPVRTDGVTAMRRSLYRRSARWVAPARTVQPRARRFSRLAIIGAGGVGSNIAHLAANADIGDEIVLVDIVRGVAAATALDLNHAAGMTGTGARCLGGEDPGLISGADVVVVTAGRARMPGMDRAELIDVNRRTVHAAAEAIRTQAPRAVVIVVTNPLDEMTLEMLRATGFPRERVLGMAGTLDSSRFRAALAMAAGVAPADVDAIALGSHGDEMAPILSLARIKGHPLSKFLTDDRIEACVRDAVTGGGQILALRRSGSATVAPAHATVEVLDHIRGARAGPVPVSVMLAGEYGIDGVVLGVPAHVGPTGLVEVEILQLTKAERAALVSAAEAVRARLSR
ncbi:MAG: malate dehydrogenase [Rhodobacter sp.]|nr:malate dehydrogenase [Rhodobacter sp.]MCY4169366.1 malate dehydrogenase [Rhodobacter sp.]MCY4243278.1 malate dehydrogenase [Rhodobacter sp.]